MYGPGCLKVCFCVFSTVYGNIIANSFDLLEYRTNVSLGIIIKL